MRSRIDFARRWRALGRAVEAQGADAFLSVRPHNIRYLNYSCAPHSSLLTHVLVLADGSPMGLATVLEMNRLQLSALAREDILLWGRIPGIDADVADSRSGLRALIKRHKVRTLLADAKVAAPGARLRVCDLVEPLRERKDDVEVRLMRKAAAAGDRAGVLLPQLLHPGVTERDVSRGVDAAIRSGDVVENSFPTIVASGPHSAHPHHDATNRVLRKGDLVITDLGACYEGYCSDMTRTWIVGEGRGTAADILDAVHQAQKAQLRQVRANRSLRAIDALGREVLAEFGMDRYFCHSTGHGLGLEVHESPRVSPLAEGKTRDRMVITIEPGVYIPKVGGARVEDDVLVRRDRGLVFNRSPKPC